MSVEWFGGVGTVALLWYSSFLRRCIYFDCDWKLSLIDFPHLIVTHLYIL